MRFKSGEEFVKNLVNEYCPEPSVLNSVRLETYFKKAHNLFHQALDLVKMGEEKEAEAYIYLMRYSQLISALQTHNNYSSKEYSHDKKIHLHRLKNSILKMEELKPRLIASYDKEIEKELTKGTSSSSSSSSSNDNNNTTTTTTTTTTNQNENLPDNEIKTNELDSSSSSSSSSKNNLSSKERWNNLLSSTNTNSNALDGMFEEREQSKIIVPSKLVKEFIKHAEKNTKSDIETCGVLTGKCDTANNCYIITHVIIPKQNGSSNTVQTINEEELIEVQEKKELITLGWIHTHPSQTCFLSSVDMHCQLSYQIMLPNAIAIVYAPKDTTLIFSLTKVGLETLSKCDCQGFHRHNVNGLYEQAKHAVYSDKHSIKFIDLRKK